MRLSIIEPLGITEDQAQDLAKEYLPDDVELTYYNTQARDDVEKQARVQGADVLMLANSPLPRSVLETATAARFISVAFTGVDHVAMDYCHEKGLVVSNCSGYANEAVSELAIGMAIGLYRKLAECDAAVRSGKTRAGLLGRELCGKNSALSVLVRSALRRRSSRRLLGVKFTPTAAQRRRYPASRSCRLMSSCRPRILSRCMCR